MKYTIAELSKDTTKKLLNYLNNNLDFKKEFLSWDYDAQKTAIKLLLTLKKI
tara:strand:+ start:3297 stop:3452 length:156 start_codon:yes stop_codon:yes gene_type:complete